MTEDQQSPPATDKARPSRPWLLALLINLIEFLAAGFAVPLLYLRSERSPLVMAMNDCRQVIISLKSYSGDHEGRYPDGKSSNEALRQLIKEGQLEDERLFASSGTFSHTDNDIGSEPEFAKALQPGENQWAMTKGLSDSSPGHAPLIFDAPAVKNWPPLWNTEHHEVPKKGDARKGGKVVIGHNDGAVSIEKLEGKGLVTVKRDDQGRTEFDRIGPHQILDAEE